MESLAIKIDYWTFPDGTPSGIEPEGIEEFRKELQQHYVALVRGNSGACGGGLYDFVVQITSSIGLQDIASAIVGGVSYDLVRSGTDSFVIRPLIKSFKKLKNRNKDICKKIEVDEFKFSFQDIDIVIKNIGIGNFFLNLEKIFIQLSKSIDLIKNKKNEYPYIIHVPIFEDPEKDICNFRSLLDVDETIVEITESSYLKYWGVRYNLEGAVKVFDVNKKLFIESSYMTQDEYWDTKEKKWSKESID